MGYSTKFQIVEPLTIIGSFLFGYLLANKTESYHSALGRFSLQAFYVC